MDNAGLDSILKKARIREPAADFWATLPHRVTGQLQSYRAPQNERAGRPGPSFFTRWAWALATAAGVVIALAAVHWNAPKNAPDVLASAKLIDETLAMFPHRVRAIVEDEHGLSLELSEHGNVPDSAPLYVRICDGAHCMSAVTFSGQQVQLAGQQWTVLADGRGGIILEGSQLLWSSAEPINADNHLKIEARNLGPATM